MTSNVEKSRSGNSKLLDMACRICAKSKSYVVSIYGDLGVIMDLPCKINKHLPIQVSMSDSLPLKICRQCLVTFTAFDEMFRYCLVAEKKLLSMVGSGLDDGELELSDDQSTSLPNWEDTLFKLPAVQLENAAECDVLTEIKVEIVDIDENGDEQTCQAEKLTHDKNLESPQLKCGTHPENFAKIGNGALETENTLSQCVSTTKQRKAVRVNSPLEIQRSGKELDKKPKSKMKITGQFSVIGDKYICVKCHSEFSDGASFTTHRIRECQYDHFECESCDASFRKKNHLNRHNFIHSAEYEFKCYNCEKIFRSKSSLRSHVKLHSDERSFKCDACTKDYKRADHLRMHQKSVHGKHVTTERNITFVVCEICSGRFCSESRLRLHQLKHTGQSPYVCDRCGKSFFSESGLKYHQTRAFCAGGGKKRGKTYYKSQKNVTPKYQCELCPRAFHFPSLLRVHIRGTHLKEKPFACKLCDLRFHNSSALQRHKAIAHTGRKYVCEICQHRCIHPSDLKLHMNSHRTDKPFSCPVCNKVFKYQGDMSRHLKKDHVSDKDRSRKPR